MDQNLIRTVNRLQDAFTSAGIASTIDLPQIVVVGSQSSGKSSVLENIVGRDFLPRGSGIVTRRPLVLQLVNAKEEYGEFLHRPRQKYTNFEEICKEIVRDTDEKTAGNLGISDLPINLCIYSPNVLTLTLVDLPGITKVAVGNQPADIEIQIRSMILRYITKPNAIILAVSAANSDIANSDALKLALEVDPQGHRTIGVLTKIDMMDPETNVVDILAGRIIPLRLGFVPVINRGQRDIDRKKPIQDALADEANFFANHNAYKSKCKFCGIPYLSSRLNTILLHQIKVALPEIKQRISTQLLAVKTEMLTLGDSGFDDPNSGAASSYILSLITEFCTEFGNVLRGSSANVPTSELVGGARISFIFHEIFKSFIDGIDPSDVVKDADIRTIVYNSSGSQPSLFWGTLAFEILVRQQIKRLEEPSLRCCSLVRDELTRILDMLLQNVSFNRFPQLREKVASVVTMFVNEALIPTQNMVSDLIAAEICYINTCHPQFISGQKATAMVTESLKPQQPQPGFNFDNRPPIPVRKEDDASYFGNFQQKKPKKQGSLEAPPVLLRPEGKLSEKEKIEIEVIKLLMSTYFAIVKNTVKDLCPKIIMLNLVQYTRENLQKSLLTELYRKEVLETVLKESDDISARRKDLKAKLMALENAEQVVKAIT